ncbi:MAG: hypothetical protein JWO51_121 [Rhodospirillales bacterium]|nr:hypothetical protein [Rhodospirillales bacterium]
MTSLQASKFPGLFTQAPHAARRVRTIAVEMDERPGGQYKRIGLDALVDLKLTDRQGRLLAERLPFLPPKRVALEPVTMHPTDLVGLEIHEEPFQGAGLQDHYEIAATPYYVLRDAIVHTSAGMVAVDNYLIGDTLANVNPAEYGVAVGPGLDSFRLSCRKARRFPGRALHALAGGADTSYYHWMIDALVRLSVPVPDALAAALLFPELAKPFHIETVDLLSQIRSIDHRAIGRDETIVVDELVYIPNLSGYGWAHRPGSLGIFDQLRATIGEPRSQDRRIYVSRMNASARPLVNEAEIVDLMRGHGYEILELEKLSVAEQAMSFAEASHIVAPHGGGLANLVFANPGASVCELHLDHYVNWCFQRLANARGLRYRCLIGTGEGPRNPDWAHATRWSIETAELRALLGREGFLG